MSINRSSLLPELATFRPVGTMTLCRRLSEPDEIGGIVLPGIAARDTYATWEIILAGPACELAKPGMKMLAPRRMVTAKVDVNGEQLDIINEDKFHAAVGDVLPSDDTPVTFCLPVTNTVRHEFPMYEVCDALKADVGDTLVITVRRAQ